VAAEAKEFQGEIDDFGPLDKETKKAIRKGLKVMCRECQMGVAAAQQALADAGLVSGAYDPTRAGISFGSDYMLTMPDDFAEGIQQCLGEEGKFELSRWAKEGMPKMSPLWLLKYLPNMPASHLAIYNNLQGPNNSITVREASPNLAVAEALQIILRGRADLMLCGATGTRLHPMKIVHALQQEEVASGNGAPERTSRPFDLHR
jgi:3-oxoacyl-[acyl-carrier-protein] synthase II